MGTMFETPKPKEKSSQTTMWIVVVIVIVVVGVGFYFYTNGKTTTAPATAAVPAAASGPADPASDLRLTESPKLQKDSTGTTAVWLINLRNRSNTYTYSHIAYETTYTGADGATLAMNHGELKDSIGPGEEQSEQFRDTLYPNGTASYRLKITGATSSIAQQ
jgi:hypothetical protein